MTNGRPTKYKPEYDVQAYRLSLLGYKDSELASFFEVTEQTINNWKNEHPSFFESINDGKDKADAMIADRLFNKAMDGDTTSMIFWLKNRQAKRWRDKQDVAMQNADGEAFKVDGSVKVEFVGSNDLDTDS